MNPYKAAWQSKVGDVTHIMRSVHEPTKQKKGKNPNILRSITANDSKLRIAFHLSAPFLIPWLGTTYNSVGWAVASQGPRAAAEFAATVVYIASLSDYLIDSNVAHNAGLLVRHLATGNTGGHDYRPLKWIYA